MHVRDLRAFSSIDFIEEKLDSCQAFAAESHLDDLVAATVFSGMEAGTTLRTLIPPKRYDKLRKILLKARLLDLDHFQKTPPLLITGFIGSQMLGNEMPFTLDERLWRRAKSAGKPVYGVETVSEQMQVLANIPLEHQTASLLSIGRNISRYRQHLLDSAMRYERCELQTMSVSSAKQSGKLRKILIHDRNQLMADRIAEMVSKESIFISIGAGHLLGGKGVLRLLKQKGLSLRAVAIAAQGES